MHLFFFIKSDIMSECEIIAHHIIIREAFWRRLLWKLLIPYFWIWH